MEKMFTVNELAKYLHLKPITIYRKARAGDIPAVRIGRSWRFPQKMIEKWLEGKLEKGSHTVKPKGRAEFKNYRGKVIGSLSRRELYSDR